MRNETREMRNGTQKTQGAFGAHFENPRPILSRFTFSQFAFRIPHSP